MSKTSSVSRRWPPAAGSIKIYFCSKKLLRKLTRHVHYVHGDRIPNDHCIVFAVRDHVNQTEVIHWKLGDLLLVIQIRAKAEKMEVELEEDVLVDVEINRVVGSDFPPPVR